MKDRMTEALEKLGIADHMGNKEGVPLEHYAEQFAAGNPAEMSARSGVFYDEAGSFFEVGLLNRVVQVTWPDMVVRDVDSGIELPAKIRILLGRLISEGQIIPGSGKFKSFAQMPNGEVYLKPFNRRSIDRMVQMFADSEAFSNACEALGARSVSGADAAYNFCFLDGLYIGLLFWDADDEFPASAQMLFSDNFSFAFSAEDMAQIADILFDCLQAVS